MTESLFTLAVTVTAVFALLTQCAVHLAMSISTAYAVVLLVLWAGMHFAERGTRCRHS